MQELSEAERYFLAAYEKETDEEKNIWNACLWDICICKWDRPKMLENI